MTGPARRVLLIGGTGKVGTRLARVLRRDGHTVRVASRSGGAVRFDWRDPDTYDSALAEIDAVFIVGPGSATDWSPLLRDLLDRAASAGVRRAVLLSARGVQFLPGGAVDRAERVLRDGPVPWSILRPSHFAQNFTEAMFVPVDGEVHAPVGGGAEPFVDVEDVAEVAASLLTDPGFENEVIEVSGPDAIDFERAMALIGDAAGRRFVFVDESPEQHVERLRGSGTPEGYITWRMAMLGGIRSGEDAYVSDGVQRVLGRQATPFEAWVRREAGVLRESPDADSLSRR
ncbi:NAD(P)H-binding protein [Agromyces sp. H66]|uniref:NAD(P)H-binding protein n=1 Tax=Agromyces sp. H66 TaxID=2529859 RepID=UPI0010A9E748|nr:NAD(P)H-binding protein [Agromyces sp. H66]